MNEAVYESGMPRMQEVTPPEVEVTDDTGTVIEQLTNTATQLDGTEDVLEQLDFLDKRSRQAPWEPLQPSLPTPELSQQS